MISSFVIDSNIELCMNYYGGRYHFKLTNTDTSDNYEYPCLKDMDIFHIDRYIYDIIINNMEKFNNDCSFIISDENRYGYIEDTGQYQRNMSIVFKELKIFIKKVIFS